MHFGHVHVSVQFMYTNGSSRCIQGKSYSITRWAVRGSGHARVLLLCSTLSNGEEVTVSGIRHSHDTNAGISMILRGILLHKHTQHGKAFQQQCLVRHLYRRSGARTSWTTWRNTLVRIFAAEGSYQRSRRAWLLVARYRSMSTRRIEDREATRKRTKGKVSTRDLLSITLQSPERACRKMYSPLPLRICFNADLYPKVYFPDFTTRARREAMDSVDFAALDFLVGAIADDDRS